MRFWWVNHKQTARQELGGGYLWSPKTEAGGKTSRFYDDLWTSPAQGDLLALAAGIAGCLSGLFRDGSRPWP